MRLLPLGRVCFREPHAESEGNAVMLGRKGLTSQAQPPDVVWLETLRNIRGRRGNTGHGESPVPEAALMPRNSLNPSGDGSR